MNASLLSRLWPLGLIALLLLAEGMLKGWAVANLSPGVDRSLLPGVLHLGFTLNPGMAWGLLGGFAAPLAVLRLLVGLILVAGLWSGRLPVKLTWPLSLIAAGALGNAVDGLARGAVVDYLTSPLLDGISRLLSSRPFPIFNLSDVLVCTGVVWLALRSRQAGRSSPSTPPSLSSQENP